MLITCSNKSIDASTRTRTLIWKSNRLLFHVCALSTSIRSSQSFTFPYPHSPTQHTHTHIDTHTQLHTPVEMYAITTINTNQLWSIQCHRTSLPWPVLKYIDHLAYDGTQTTIFSCEQVNKYDAREMEIYLIGWLRINEINRELLEMKFVVV